MPWYKGPNLLEALDSISPSKWLPEFPLRIYVEGTFTMNLVDLFVACKVQTGTVKTDSVLLVQPVDSAFRISSLTKNGQKVEEAYAGDYVHFHIENCDPAKLKRGQIISNATIDKTPANLVK